MGSQEFFIVIGVIVVSLLFFSIIYFNIGERARENIKNQVKAEASELTSLVYRVFNDPAKYLKYCVPINLANITIEKGIFKYEREGFSFTNALPPNISDTTLSDVVDFCIVKTDHMIKILGTAPTCEIDRICSIDECKENCIDCYGPASVCVGDKYCNKDIGENCEISPDDCSCSSDYICCPEDPNSNEFGCIDKSKQNKKKGEECFCNNQCEAGLECNPVAPSFTKYKKACCEPGKSWNGIECVVSECKYPCVPGCKLPDKWDWRNVDGVNYLNPVRNQGFCGSCWAFSAVGAMEGTYNVEKNLPASNKDLSEQQLVSNDNICCGYCGDCGGGFPHLAFNYIKNTGIVDEICFSYRASNAPCRLCSGYKLWKISSFGSVSTDLTEIKRAIICYGPLSVASFNWRHAIVLVGYDDNNQRWVIRNSWGSGWGEGGYGYIPYFNHPYSDIRNYVFYVKGVIEP